VKKCSLLKLAFFIRMLTDFTAKSIELVLVLYLLYFNRYFYIISCQIQYDYIVNIFPDCIAVVLSHKYTREFLNRNSLPKKQRKNRKGVDRLQKATSKENAGQRRILLFSSEFAIFTASESRS